MVIEDSHIGQRAAHDAGMRCVVTKSRYTEDEDFDVADAVVDCIGDAGDERFSLDQHGAGPHPCWTDLRSLSALYLPILQHKCGLLL